MAEDAPGLRGTVVINDGSGAGTGDGTEYEAALAAASPVRDFPPRSSERLHPLHGGPTGYPKGVMWRHEDIWRTLGGGIDFTTGIPLPDEWEQSRRGLESTGLVRLCAAPLIHGLAQVGTLMGLFAGDTIVLLSQFDAHKVWRAVERHKINLLLIVGDAMARPLIEAYQSASYDASSLVAIRPRPRCSRRSSRRRRQDAAQRRHHRGDRLLRDRLRRPGLRHRRAGAGGPTVDPGP